jgi:NAD(P)-dependent dehydrogenase (short-subunit alcohol dehydrogenase family)
MSKKRIVITGCSSGFGRVTAAELARRGWHVFGTVRKESDRESLLNEAMAYGYEENLTIVLCDITAAEQIAALVERVKDTLQEEAAGDPLASRPELDALLNNAGTAYAGPMELMQIDDLRAQFELNVIAQVAVTQALLPMLKAAHGTVINVSSLGGRVSMPVTGAYNASKFAIEAISDAWRIELSPFGVHVVVIEPGSSPTSIWQTSLQRSLDRIGQHRDGPYRRLMTLSERAARRSTKQGFPPQLFADTVVKILTGRRPRARYAIPFSTRVQIVLRSLLPDRLWDYLVRRVARW